MAHPGEDASGDIIMVSAPRCTLLRATEELGLCKTYSNGKMEAFSYHDRDNFKDSGKAGTVTVFMSTLNMSKPEHVRVCLFIFYSTSIKQTEANMLKQSKH